MNNKKYIIFFLTIGSVVEVYAFPYVQSPQITSFSANTMPSNVSTVQQPFRALSVQPFNANTAQKPFNANTIQQPFSARPAQPFNANTIQQPFSASPAQPFNANTIQQTFNVRTPLQNSYGLKNAQPIPTNPNNFKNLTIYPNQSGPLLNTVPPYQNSVQLLNTISPNQNSAPLINRSAPSYPGSGQYFPKTTPLTPIQQGYSTQFIPNQNGLIPQQNYVNTKPDDTYTSKSSDQNNFDHNQKQTKENIQISTGPVQGKLSFGGLVTQMGANVLKQYSNNTNNKSLGNVADAFGALGKAMTTVNDQRDKKSTL
ncbi:hypothetical protein [Holospora obtusa]|nr:hypothetical protein [Holospora obtusa]